MHKERVYKEETLDHYKQQIDLVVKYILSNLDRRLTLDELSEKAEMSHFHFQRVFKRVTGYGFREFIRNELLEVAAHDLKTTLNSIKNIQEKIHYDTPEVFCRAFKAKFGVSPSKYRLENSLYK